MNNDIEGRNKYHRGATFFLKKIRHRGKAAYIHTLRFYRQVTSRVAWKIKFWDHANAPASSVRDEVSNVSLRIKAAVNPSKRCRQIWVPKFKRKGRGEEREGLERRGGGRDI